MTERSESPITVEASRQQVKDKIGRLFFDPEIREIDQTFPEIENSWLLHAPKTLSKYPGLSEHTLEIVKSSRWEQSYNVMFRLLSPRYLRGSGLLSGHIMIDIDRNDFGTQLKTEIIERTDCRITRVDDEKSLDDEIKRNEIVCELLDLLLADQERLSAQD